MGKEAGSTFVLYVSYRLLHAFDGSGRNLTHIFLIPWVKILVWFHIQNLNPGAKMKWSKGAGSTYVSVYVDMFLKVFSMLWRISTKLARVFLIPRVKKLKKKRKCDSLKRWAECRNIRLKIKKKSTNILIINSVKLYLQINVSTAKSRVLQLV